MFGWIKSLCVCKRFMSFDEARAYAQTLGLGGSDRWQGYAK